MGRKRADVDWAAIKLEYVSTSISLRDLAKKYGVNKASVFSRSRDEKWADQRAEYQIKIIAKAERKTANKEVNRLARLIDATTKAIDVAMEAFEDDKQFNRHIVYESPLPGTSEAVEKIFGKVDTKALRDLTGVLKDLTGLMREFYAIPTPAQAEAQRIAAERLELEKRKADAEQQQQDTDVQIVFSDEMEDYAK